MQILVAVTFWTVALALSIAYVFTFFMLGGRVAGIIPLRAGQVLALTVAWLAAATVIDFAVSGLPVVAEQLAPAATLVAAAWLAHHFLKGSRLQTGIVVVTFVVGQALAMMLPSLFDAALMGSNAFDPAARCL